MKAVMTLDKNRASIKDYISFTKAILSFAVGLPGVMVYLLATNEISSSLGISFLAIFGRLSVFGMN